MLELHEINLRNDDRLKLKKLCETKGNMIKYKDALALIQVNKAIESTNQGFWVLQIPQRKDTSKQFLTPQKDDTRSQMSGMSHYSDVSIDPVMRLKAEKILENQMDKINSSQLEVIHEESKLTSNALKNLSGANRLDLD